MVEEIKEKVKGLKERALEFIKNSVKVRDVFFLSIGFALAVFMCWNIYNWRMDEATFQGNIVYKSKVYSIIWDATKVQQKEVNK